MKCSDSSFGLDLFSHRKGVKGFGAGIPYNRVMRSSSFSDAGTGSRSDPGADSTWESTPCTAGDLAAEQILALPVVLELALDQYCKGLLLMELQE